VSNFAQNATATTNTTTKPITISKVKGNTTAVQIEKREAMVASPSAKLGSRERASRACVVNRREGGRVVTHAAFLG
jgi:hypothetical protein